MSVNTTQHLIDDIERLRTHLGIDRWMLNGASWGVTLILAYAQQHPGRVTEVVVPAVTMCRRSEIDWLYTGSITGSLGSSRRNGIGFGEASPPHTT